MKSENIAQVDSIGNGYKWNSATERFAEHRRLVALVAVTYTASKQISPIVAMNCDPAPESRSPKWSPATAEFIADVELAIRRTLEFKAETDRKVLRDAWERFLEDDSNIDATQKRLINLLAPAFYRRELHPGMYFRPRRLTRKRSR